MDTQKYQFTQYCLFDNYQPFQDYFQTREPLLSKEELKEPMSFGIAVGSNQRQQLWPKSDRTDVRVDGVTAVQKKADVSLKRARMSDLYPGNENSDELAKPVKREDIVSLKRARISDIYPTNDIEDDSIAQCTNSVLADYLLFKKNKAKKRKEVCVFCKNNAEPEAVYSSHVLKDIEGRTVCPILRRYVCPICGKTGEDSHTIKYCPLNTGLNASAYLARACRAIEKQNF